MTDAPYSGRRTLRLFATPVVIDELDDAAALNGQLATAILERRKKDPGLRLSNQGGWQSTHDLQAWTGEAGRRILDHATALATDNSETEGSEIHWEVDAWANVSAAGASNRAHVHGGSFWSAVYYVEVGDGDGGALVLYDPRMPGLRMHAPGLRFRDCGSEVFASILPKAGRLILFPAWLSHSVEPWEGSGTRISIAMNIRSTTTADKKD
ncbi:MAG: 2OG-Fe(II) oxygenase family protein [Sphingomicrobium sp.]